MANTPSVKDIEPLVERYKGNIAAIARHFGVSRGTIYNRMAESVTLKAAMEDERQTMLDNAESALYKQAMEGNTTALIFLLKTQGKQRGYTERVEVQERDWRDEVIDALRRGELTAEQVRAAYPSLADDFFRKAGVDA
jgi:hypothetical protein